MQHIYSMQHATYMEHAAEPPLCVRNATHVVVLKNGEVVEAGKSLVPSPARPLTQKPALALPRVNEGH